MACEIGSHHENYPVVPGVKRGKGSKKGKPYSTGETFVFLRDREKRGSDPIEDSVPGHPQERTATGIVARSRGWARRVQNREVT
jgi:hypothetical protein